MNNKISMLEEKIEELNELLAEKEKEISGVKKEYQKRLDAVSDTISKAKNECYSLSNTKIFRFIHFSKRVKSQLICGNFKEKKAFFKWLKGHAKNETCTDRTYNPIFNVVSILDTANTSEIELKSSSRYITKTQLPYVYDKTDIIILSVIDYDFRHQRPQHFADMFARGGHRTFYINTSFDSNETKIEEKDENLFTVTLKNDKGVLFHSSKIGKSMNVLKREIENLIYTYAVKDCCVIVDYPTWQPLAEKLKTKYGFKLVLDYMDDYMGFEDTADSNVSSCCEKLLKSCDLAVTSSLYLKEKASKYTDKICLIRNGTQTNHFYKAFGKKRNTNKKVVGYYGAVAHWFDFEKVIYAAKNIPDADFIIIGEVTNGKDKLEKISNIKLTGEVAYKDLPGYVADFDVCLIPFDSSTDLIKATNPVKFYEYLSAGKKIVATNIPELEEFKDKYVYLSDDKEEFCTYIKKCLVGDDCLASAEKCVEFAKENDWTKRFEMLENEINSLYPLVSIVVLTYNQLDYTKKCINSIIEKTAYPNYELILVDNLSTDDTREYLKTLNHEKIKVILNEENYGFAKGNNIGIQNSEGEYIMLLNNDTVVTPGYITNLVKHMEQNPEIGLIGPVTNSIGNEAMIPVNYTNENYHKCFKFSDYYTHVNMGNLYTRIPVLAMFCTLIPKAIIEKAGMLDENYGRGMFEDDDYSKAVTKAGYSVVCAEDAFVHHFGSASFKAIKTGEYKKIFDANLAYFEKKWNTKWIPHIQRPGFDSILKNIGLED